MKYIFLKLFVGVLFLTSNSLISQSVEITLQECNSFRSSHFLELSKDAVFSIQLEREISPNLWLVTQKVQTDDKSYTFSNLENGNYRTTLLETIKVGENSNVYKKISNIVKIDCAEVRSSATTYDLFSISPNPAKNEIYINLEKTPDPSSHFTFEISNLIGSKVKEGHLHNTKERVELTNIAGGSYIVVIKDHEKTILTKKLIITKN